MGDPLSLTDPNGQATSYTYNTLAKSPVSRCPTVKRMVILTIAKET